MGVHLREYSLLLISSIHNDGQVCRRDKYYKIAIDFKNRDQTS
jgi:hypothetical protein